MQPHYVRQECSEYIWDENITFKKLHCNISLQNDCSHECLMSV